MANWPNTINGINDPNAIVGNNIESTNEEAILLALIFTILRLLYRIL